MEIILSSFFMIFLSEMGDKTQLLSLVLVSRYKQPWTIFFGVLFATLLNHAVASWFGDRIPQFISPTLLPYLLAGTFFAFAIWVLIPDKEGEIRASTKWGAFLTTFVSFFIAEMGDKTQLVTIAAAAKYQSVTLVTIGTTLGMLAANGLVIFLGPQLIQKVSMKWVRRISSLLFVLFGVAILTRSFVGA